MILSLNANAKMDEASWKKLKYMGKNNNWGDPSKISSTLAFNMENMRIASGRPITLTCPAYTPAGGHSTKSLHYEGKACDWTMTGASLLEMYLWAIKFPFNGIGLYPNNGRPFMHTDVRDFTGQKDMWVAIGEPNNWTYISFDVNNFRKYVL